MACRATGDGTKPNFRSVPWRIGRAPAGAVSTVWDGKWRDCMACLSGHGLSSRTIDNMVDDTVNRVDVPVAGDLPGFALPLLLLAGFRHLIDDLHAELDRRGHPGMRPAYGFALQAVGPEGATATEVGRRLGISKQAAGKTIDRLASLDYVARGDDLRDARRKQVRLTAAGLEVLRLSAEILGDLRAEWSTILGAQRVRTLEGDLRKVTSTTGIPLDVAGWLGG